MRRFAVWANVGLFSDDFERLWHGQGAIFLAFLEDVEAQAEERDIMRKGLFWIGRMLSTLGTAVCRFLGIKLPRTLGELHGYDEWQAKSSKSSEAKRQEMRNPQNWISMQ